MKPAYARWMTMLATAAALAAAFTPAKTARGDGMIVPVLPEHRVIGQWAVKHHHVDIKVRDQIASVTIDQEFVNIGKGMLEVEYLFPVPPQAAIDSLTLVVDGKEFTAKLYKADEARKIYEDIVRKKKDPALLEYVGFGLYKTSAFPLESGKPAKVVVTYKSICRRDRDTVEVWYPLNTEKFSAQAIESVRVTTDIQSKADISAVYSPTHDLTVDRKDSRHVVATYEAKGVIPAADFQVFYTSSDEAVAATLLTHQPDKNKDGYFLLLVSPNPRKEPGKVAAKDILLAIDRSGSMSGEKFNQAKEAAAYILKHLNAEDRFNVVFYSDSVEPLSKGLQPADETTVAEALGRLDRMDAGGQTNIYEALQVVFKQLNLNERSSRPQYVIFLTDGLPTVYPPGKSSETDILNDAKKANESGARLFAFGVGYDVNVRLLDRLAGDHGGRSDYAKPKEPIEGKITSLYGKIRNPVMTHVEIDLKDLRVRDVYPRTLGDLFEGDQIVAAGRFYGEDIARLRASSLGVYETQLVIRGVYEGKPCVFEYPVTVRPASDDPTWGFVEKLWAMRRVGYLLDQIQLNGQNKEIIDELVELSRTYGIMTPYTSFLADETVKLGVRPEELHRRAEARLGELNQVTGDVGQRGAMNRQMLNDASKASAAPAREPGGMGGTTVWGYADKDSYEAKKSDTVQTVRQVGNQAVYRRGNLWAAGEAVKLDVAKDAARIKTIDRFSDEYFELTRRNSAEENQILSQQAAGEELLITLGGQAYLIK